MANDGIITRKELITDESLRWGSDYEKELDKAIAKNKEFILSVKEYSGILKSLKGVNSNTEFQKAKQREVEVLKQASVVWKEQTQLENQVISTMRKRELAQESTNRKLIEERTLLQQTNKEIKQEILARINQEGAYKKLDRALGNVRTQAKNVKAEMFLLEQQGKANTTAYNNLRLRSVALTAQTNILDKGIKDIDSSLGLHQRNVGNYESALSNISPIFGRVNQQLGAMGLSLDQLANTKTPFKELTAGIANFGRATLAFLVSPVGLALVALGGLFALIRSNKDTVIEFNSGLLNVGKTTGIADDELSQLGGDIVKLSRDLKTVGTPSLLEYATVAGQLGVKGSENILKFTKALAQLETASNISGEEGGAQIARLLTLTDGGVQNVQDFGDEIVKLGNNFAATEKEILETATAIAQNTGVYKVGRQDILAYATATKAVGIEAELTGSTIGRTLGLMEKSIRTGENIATIANLTNQSVEDLKTSFKQDSSSVLFSFVEGLNAVDASGGSVNEQLEKLGITSVRDQRVIASLATGGFGTLAKAMEDVRTANGALAEEFETAQGKLENQLKRTGIAWDNFVLSLENGQGVISKLATVIVGEFANYIEKLTSFIDELGIAWSVLMSYFEDSEDSIEKTETGFSNLLKTLFSVQTYALAIQLAFYKLLKLFLVDLPNALNRANGNFIILKDSITDFATFVIRVSPEIRQYILDMLNPFKEANADGLIKSFDQFKNQLIKGNKQITEDVDKENKKRLDDFNARYNASRNKVGEAELEEEKKRLQAERDKLEEEASADEKKKREEALKKQKELADAEFALYQFRAKNAMDSNKAILDDDKSTLEQRIDAFSENAQLEVDLITETAKKKLIDISRYNDEVRDLTNNEITNLLNGNEIKKTLSDAEILALEEYQASILANTKRFNKERQSLIDEEINNRKKLIEGTITGIGTGENDSVRGVTNQYAADLEAFKGTEEERIKLKENYEKRILEIQRESLSQELDLRISTLEKLAELELSPESRIKLENEISKAKLDIANLELDKKEEILDRAFEMEQQNAERIKELYMNLASVSIDLTNNIFDARINKISEEIDANNERYDKWLEKENLTEEQKDEIEAIRAEKNKKLEEKRQKEILKQEIFNRTIALGQVAVDLAKTINAINLAAVAMDALAPYAFGAVGATYRGLQIGLAVGTAAIQTANILAAPLPKYEFGTDDHKGGFAQVAEKRPEVILEPNKAPYVVSKPSILDLPKHTQVVPSLNEYEKLQRASLMTSLDLQMDKINGNDNASMVFDDRYSAEIVQELKKMNKKKMSVNVQPAKIDLGHQIWRSNNIKWNS